MQEFSLIKENILKFIDSKGISKYEFYHKTGITRGVLDHKSGLTEGNIAKFIAYYPEINLEWLITGKGEMLKTGMPPDEVPISKNGAQKKHSLSGECFDNLINRIQIQAEEIGRLKKQIEDLKETIVEMSKKTAAVLQR